MRPHENKTLFRQAVAATSQSMEIQEIYIEKDYWVTFALSIELQKAAAFFISHIPQLLVVIIMKDITAWGNREWRDDHHCVIRLLNNYAVH